MFESGSSVVSITLAGLAANLKCFEMLGANLDYETLNPRFRHPSISNFCVSVILDACHMIKLFKNLFHDYKEL